VFRQWRRTTSRQKHRAARRIRLNALDNGANFGSLPSRQTRVRIGKKCGGRETFYPFYGIGTFLSPPSPTPGCRGAGFYSFALRVSAAIKRVPSSFDETSGHEFPATCRSTTTSRGDGAPRGKKDTPYRIDETRRGCLLSLSPSARGALEVGRRGTPRRIIVPSAR